SAAASMHTSTGTTRSAATVVLPRSSSTSGWGRSNTNATMDRSSPSNLAALSAQGVREWWLRTALVLQAPRAVFVALRADDRNSAANRSEPVLLIILLAGMALAIASAASTDYAGLDLAVWIFLAGGMTGIAAYWAF